MRKAVALRYDRQKNQAPEVVASGQGLIAEKLLEMAMENRVPFYEHHELVEALATLPLGSEIPPELYELVAQILAFVLRIDEEQSRDEGSNGDR
ncbi:MAG TPA: EscU/YscU/HrcU family type III secretion system export apparatus switch protein [Limnochordia bacterium]|jgi:flagellar biosynthesis protein|nr:EscU/YscU/HrcU family type III secretion system export apparatus switch protein [Limnochordia bacterium]